jgi:hypothetical protein
VFSNSQYKPRDGSHDFRHDANPGDLFELTTTKTKAGNPNLLSARKIGTSPPAKKPRPAPARHDRREYDSGLWSPTLTSDARGRATGDHRRLPPRHVSCLAIR